MPWRPQETQKMEMDRWSLTMVVNKAFSAINATELGGNYSMCKRRREAAKFMRYDFSFPRDTPMPPCNLQSQKP